MPEIKVGLKIDGTPPADQSLEHGLTIVHWIGEDDAHHVYVQAEGFDESGEGAQAVAELLRDASETILVELGAVEPPKPQGFNLGQDTKPDIRSYQTPARVQKAREDRAQRRHDRKFRPHA